SGGVCGRKVRHPHRLLEQDLKSANLPRPRSQTAAAAAIRCPAENLLEWTFVSCRGRTMGSMSIMHWMVVLAIVLVLFGAGKLPRVMGDFAKGIKAFKSGMKEEDETAATTPHQQVPPPSGTATSAAAAGNSGSFASSGRDQRV